LYASAACAGCVMPRLPSSPAGSSSTATVAPAPIVVSVEAGPSQSGTPTGTMTANPGEATGNNILWNGKFDGKTIRPWSLGFESSRNGRGGMSEGELCIRIDQAGAHTFDVALRQGPIAINRGHRYQLRFRTHATAATHVRPKLSTAHTPSTLLWGAVVPSEMAATTYTGTFDATTDSENVELVFEFGGDLAGPSPLTVCLDEVELNDPQFQIPLERAAGGKQSAIRVNQVGYLPDFAKTATVATSSVTPIDWHLIDANGRIRASGKTRPFGSVAGPALSEDPAAGETVHLIDFSSVTDTGKQWKLRVGDDESYPFEIGPDIYRHLKYDALAFFYLQRSGVDIKMPYAGTAAYERPAGHVGDKSVPCAPEAHCNYALDVSGGWYDAGDHGKYVVNSAISVWTLQNQFETLARFGATAGDFADGKLKIPEAGNGRSDLLDEARFNLEFMLKMQVPPGQPLAGMVHHKIHGEKWSDIPTLPHEDHIKRYLRPVSTAATLDLAATAAQGARLWQKQDPSFANRCLVAAEIAFAAAKKTPLIRAEPEVQGGGAYGDGDVSDDLYWAAAELFITTSKPVYRDELVRSRFHAPKPMPVTSGNMGWDHVAPLGKLSLSVAPNALGEAAIAEQRGQIVGAAERFLANIEKRGYRMPLASDSVYVWGSNAGVLNAAVVLGSAYYFTKDTRFANGVIECMNYILGRNPLAQSYVAGYGSHAMHNPHHRVWAHQKNARLPEAPAGAVSGGPNSMLQDPYIRKLGKSGCPPQTCYVDHVESYSTNEVAINWNAPLAWDAAFLDNLERIATKTRHEVSISRQ
jgi:endoglucanase